MIQVTWIRDNRLHDEARYRIKGPEGRVFDVIISLTSKAKAKPSPEQKIGEWFRYHPLSASGTVDKIPDHFFSD
jgi:hypothetical protein